MSDPAQPLTTVFLHGFLGQPADWADVQAHLGPSLRVRVPVLPGHGAGAARTEDEFVRQQSEMGPCRVVGYSMGGRLALRWALASPRQVRSLVLVSASPGIEGDIDRAERRARDARWAMLLRAGDREAFLKAWYEQPVFASLHANPYLLADVCRRRARGSLRDLAEVVERMSPGAVPSLWRRLGELGQPVLHVAGERDVVYAGMAARAAGLSPRGEKHSIPNSGHAVAEEQPAALAAVLLAWWQRVARVEAQGN